MYYEQVDMLLSKLDKNSAVLIEDSAQKLQWSHSTTHCCLQQHGKMPKLGNDMTETNHKERMDICTSLHSHEHILLFLDRLANGDKKKDILQEYKATQTF